MHVLTITTLYPNALQPRHGIFVKNRLAAMDDFENFSRKVIAPIPHCPFISKISSRYKLYEDIPAIEKLGEIEIYHPRYFTLPGIKFFDNATSMAKAAETIISDVYKKNLSFDIVDGQYLYPDGVAAYKVAKNHNKPLILTARGSDVNFWMKNEKVRTQIIEAINYSSKVICVSNALKETLISYGVPNDKIIVIINGIDPKYFNTTVNANPLRDDYFLSVGNLTTLKGHHITLQAFAKLPKEKLIIVGDGDQRKPLKKLTKGLGLTDRVQFIKHLDQEKLAEFYAGAKATILMSSMEGMPNVILESLAVGTPVIASNVGGVPEVVTNENGVLLNERTIDGLLDGIEKIQKLNTTREKIATTVEKLRWSEAANQQFEIYKNSLHIK